MKSKVLLLLLPFALTLAACKDAAISFSSIKTASKSSDEVVLGSLMYFTQPSTSAVAGVNLAVQPVVHVKKPDGNIDTSYVGSVSFAEYSDPTCSTPTAGGNGGTSSAVAGVVTVTGASLFKVGSRYIKATASGYTSACSNAVTITPNSATQLVFTQNAPATASAGSAFSNSVIVEARDAYGNVDTNYTSPVTLSAKVDSSCVSAAAGTVGGGSMSFATGTANFGSVSYTKAETIYLKATSSVLMACNSAPIAVSPGAIASLAYSVAPSSTGTAGVSLAVNPTVEARDANNNLVTAETGSVTLSAYSNPICTTPGGGTFSGTITSAMTSGVASSFSSISYTTSGSLYIKATHGAFTVCSPVVTISPGAAFVVNFGVNPPAAATAGTVISPNITASVYDSFGNWRNSDTGNIDIGAFVDSSCLSPAVGTLNGNSVAMVAGLSTFSALNYTKAESVYFKVSKSGVPNGSCYSAIATVVSPGAPNKVLYVTQPAGALVKIPFQQQPTAQITDLYNNFISGYSGSFAMGAYIDSGCSTAAGGTLSGNIGSVTGGMITPNSLQYDRSENIYIKANVTGLTSACSASPLTVYHQFNKLVLGNYSSCGLTAGGVACWGYAAYGSNLDGTTGSSSNTSSMISGSNFQDVSKGEYHACVIQAGAVFCSGLNDMGQLGNATNCGTSSNNLSLLSAGISGATALASGLNHTCVVANGGVKCFGNNNYQQIGTASKVGCSTAYVPSGLTAGVTAIAVSNLSSCAIQNGAVKCWGDDAFATLGVNIGGNTAVPQTAIASGATAIAGGGSHYCAIVSGALKCWGSNGSGQLGTADYVTYPTPQTVIASGVTDVVAGASFTCAIVNGVLKCFGNNGVGQLGLGDYANRNVPTAVTALSGVKSVAAKLSHACALDENGVKCWGYNNFGQLGVGDTTDRNTPTAVNGAKVGLIRMAAGGSTSCAIVGSKLKCWGDGGNGQLGNGTNAPSLLPVTVRNSANTADLSGVQRVAVGGSYGNQGHTCAVVSGAAYCWGSNSNGQLGNGSYVASNLPVAVTSMGSDVTDIFAQGNHTCAIKAGLAYCWGQNTYGSLGDNTTTDRTTPVAVFGTLDGLLGMSLSSSSGSSQHTCAWGKNGDLKCFGRNFYGELGDTTTSNSAFPVTALASGGVLSAAAGSWHTCAVSNGALKCVGNNDYGALGVIGYASTNTTFVTPVASNVSRVSAGNGFTCYVESGTAKCFGLHSNGGSGGGNSVLLGVNSGTFNTCAGSNDCTYNPQTVVSLNPSTTELAAGTYHTCSVNDGFMKCWGFNSSGQLGNNSSVNSATPVNVQGLYN